MTNRIFAASYERGIELTAVGCPLDYPDALPRRLGARRMPLFAQQLDGYAESCVYALGRRTVYVIGLRLGTDVPGAIITEWNVVPPWQEQVICWEYAPEDIIPKRDWGTYASLVDSRLMGVLNDRRLLRRGYPIDGLVCGCSSQPIPESCAGSVSAKLTIVDDAGNTVALPIGLAVFRPVTRALERIAGTRKPIFGRNVRACPSAANFLGPDHDRATHHAEKA